MIWSSIRLNLTCYIETGFFFQFNECILDFIKLEIIPSSILYFTSPKLLLYLLEFLCSVHALQQSIISSLLLLSSFLLLKFHLHLHLLFASISNLKNLEESGFSPLKIQEFFTLKKWFDTKLIFSNIEEFC